MRIGFALRHVSDLVPVFRAYRRVLRPRGVLCILELTRPRRAWSTAVLKLYLRGTVPSLSQLIASDAQTPLLMRYFWDAIEACIAPSQVMQAFEAASFHSV